MKQLECQTTRLVQQISLALLDFCRASAVLTEPAAIVSPVVVVLVGRPEVDRMGCCSSWEALRPVPGAATDAGRRASTVEEFVVEVAVEEKPDGEEGVLEERWERDCCSAVEP